MTKVSFDGQIVFLGMESYFGDQNISFPPVLRNVDS